MRVREIIAVVIFSVGLSGCSLDNLINGDDPPEGTVVDPNEVSTYEGAVKVYYSALMSMTRALNVVTEDVGVFTDELGVNSVTGGSHKIEIDSRAGDVLQGNGRVRSSAYTELQTTRIRAEQAAQLLRQYGNAASGPLIGHAYALEAHAILVLAEMYCSGIPLTRVPFGGDVQYTSALSTTALLDRAIALFDTAYEYGKDSLPIATFARVGKGRALLNLGKYAEAAAAVNDVPTNAVYAIDFTTITGGVLFWKAPELFQPNIYYVLNREGTNGIKWASDTAANQDARVPFQMLDPDTFQLPLNQTKYTSGAVSVVVANGIQARMIEAEAQLQPATAPQGAWLTTINDVRATIGLSPLSDPGNAAERIDLLFRERAFWFYLNGQRLGDMRRLVRNYGRAREQVYPIGLYLHGNPSYPTYGNGYVFTPPTTEAERNPLYDGCLDDRP